MDVQVIRKVLNSYGLKLTTPRSKVLEILFSQEKAVSFGEIVQSIKKAVDRATVYRTLRAFEEIGIVQRIAGPDHAQQYSLFFPEKDKPDTDSHRHLFFSCTKCRSVLSLDELTIPAITLPDTYTVQSLNMTVTGVCENCNQQSHGEKQ